MGESQTQQMVFKKETAGTYVYAQDASAGKAPIMTQVYIAKWALPSKPAKIEVTVKSL